MAVTRKATAAAVRVITVGAVNEFELLIADMIPANSTMVPLLASPYYGKRTDVQPDYDKDSTTVQDSTAWDAHKATIRTRQDAAQRALCVDLTRAVMADGPDSIIIYIHKGACDFIADDVAPVYPEVANVDVVKAWVAAMVKRGVKAQNVD